MKSRINYIAILLFYVVAILCRYFTNKTPLLDEVSNEFLKMIVQGIGPAVGGILVFSVFKIKPILTLKGNYKKLYTPLLLYWLLPIVLISVVQYYLKGTLSFTLLIGILTYGLLEEIGWRGFLQQELKVLPEFLNILIVATLWFIWHLNFDLTVSNLLFFGILILGSWGIGKVANSTHSLLAVAGFHSLNNFFSEMNQATIFIIAALLICWIVSLIIRKKRAIQLIN